MTQSFRYNGKTPLRLPYKQSAYPLLERSVTHLIDELKGPQYTPLTPSVEAEFCRRLKLTKDEERKKIKERLIETNLRFVAKEASKWAPIYSGDFMDLFQEGVLGLSCAIERFEQRDYRLLAYATHWITQSIRLFLDAESKMPIDLNVTLEDLVRYYFGGWNPREDVLEASEDFRMHYLVMFYQLLSPREYLILKLRFGLDPVIGKPMKLKDIGPIFGLHLERVRQIIKEVMKKVREEEPRWST